VSLKHVAPTILFPPYFIHAYMHAMLKHDSYLYCITFVSAVLPLDDGLDMGRHA
jgi:metal-dependent HD superfamily phosphatase/phosphodiesterase